MQIKGKYLNENTIGVILIIVTVALYHIAAWILELKILRDILGNATILWFLLPGIISFVAYAMLTKNIVKAVVVGILSNVFWFIWTIIYVFISYEIY